MQFTPFYCIIYLQWTPYPRLYFVLLNSNDKAIEEMNKIIENDILKNEYDSVTMERDWGDMDIILIPSDDSISEEGIQITQQLLNSPIVKE